MPADDHRNDFPENAPRRLIEALQEAGGVRKLSRRLGVNIFYISQLLHKGIEPTDQTEKGRETRAKLFLPKRKPKPKISRPEEWPGQKQVKKAIRRMVKQTNKDVLRRTP